VENHEVSAADYDGTGSSIGFGFGARNNWTNNRGGRRGRPWGTWPRATFHM